MDEDELRAVAEDLGYLRSWGDDLKDADIRRGTAVLRRLLVEDAYGRTWRALGYSKEPSLIAVDLFRLSSPLQPHQLKLGLAVGASFRGIQMAGMVVAPGPLQPSSSPASLRVDGYPGEAKFRLSEFLSSPSGVVEGTIFSRREVIKYIANIKGGVHLDPVQRKAEQKLVARLSKFEKKFQAFGTEGLLVEALAIGQAVGRSDDADTVISKVLS